MTAEVWNGEPPDADDRGDWQEQAEAQLHSPSRELALWGVAAGPMDTYVHLSDTDGRWQVRVYCEGRREVAVRSLHTRLAITRYGEGSDWRTRALEPADRPVRTAAADPCRLHHGHA
nr:hypothetical protein [Streptomyces sp. S1D4-11]QIZ00429.1 hypothetical protein HEP87_49790 [Streptomyces sp. S1D4-11]